VPEAWRNFIRLLGKALALPDRRTFSDVGDARIAPERFREATRLGRVGRKINRFPRGRDHDVLERRRKVPGKGSPTASAGRSLRDLL